MIVVETEPIESNGGVWNNFLGVLSVNIEQVFGWSRSDGLVAAHNDDVLEGVLVQFVIGFASNVD